ncbi:MAG: helix-hairpin-helix domain-containing protein [Lachnospiraceae bacterium]|nr:helix-hairpin-helix domain-containing protein [Lachnospiraceae bacterium]
MDTCKKRTWIPLIMAAILLLSGCGSKNTPELQEILQNTKESETESSTSDSSGEGTNENGSDSSGQSSSQGIKETADGDGAESGAQTADSVVDDPEENICVFVCGEVVSPGVYYFAEGARKVDAVEAAGGFTEAANQNYVNLAELLTDEMQLYIPAVGEELSESAQEAATETQAAHAGQINLNTASLEELCTLNGIGESKASAILSYREEHGGFDSIEELTQVSGIGESTLEKIKDKIYVEQE